jgi:hypothetical protein
MKERRSMLPLGSMFVLSWRYLWRNYRRTLIMLLAISVGVWAMIFMTALMRGMVDQMIEDGIDALPGTVQIHNPLYRDDPRRRTARGARFECRHGLDGARPGSFNDCKRAQYPGSDPAGCRSSRRDRARIRSVERGGRAVSAGGG